MDLRSALNAAVSSLTATQYQISVAASNIANASVEGYTAKSANLATTITSGNATGVSITSVDRYTNANLFNTLLDQTGDTAYLETLSTYLGAAVDSFGSTESNSSISHLLTELETAVAELAVSPESDNLKTMVIEAAVAVADSCQSMSSDIQSQRAAADSAIEVAVDELNAALETIDELNEQISRRTAMGQSIGDLEDARDQALLTVSQYLDVNAFYTANNTLQIYTDDGLALVDSQAHTLEYTAAGGMSASTTYPGTISGIMLDGKDITTRIDDGTIGALIAVRDTELPALQAELDTLATALADSVNAALSEGATYPGADTLTSTTAVDAADAFSGTGTVRIAVVDGDGMTVEFADLDLSTFSTMQDVVDAIDAIDGIDAAIDSDGTLTISATADGTGIAINPMDSAVGTDSENFSAFFGFNDLFLGDSAATLEVNSTYITDESRLPTGVLSSDSSLAVGDRAISSGDTTIVDALSEALTADTAFAATGNLSATNASFAEYGAKILTGLSDSASLTEARYETAEMIREEASTDYANATGVNVDEETAKLSALEDQYSASAQILATIKEMFEVLLDAVD